jgi:hypothetical protein
MVPFRRTETQPLEYKFQPHPSDIISNDAAYIGYSDVHLGAVREERYDEEGGMTVVYI